MHTYTYIPRAERICRNKTDMIIFPKIFAFKKRVFCVFQIYKTARCVLPSQREMVEEI